MFGPNNKHFQEAQGLLARGGGFEIAAEDDFKRLMDRLMTDSDFLRESGRRAGDFVKSCTGATDKILAAVQLA